MFDMKERLNSLYGMTLIAVDEDDENAPESGQVNIRGNKIYVLSNEWDDLKQALLKNIN